MTIVVSVDRATATRLGLGRSREVGRAQRRLGARATTTVAVRLSSRARRGLRAGRTIMAKLAVTAVDSAGNRARIARSLTVPGAK